MNETRNRSRLHSTWLALIAALALALAACGTDTGGGGQSFGNGDDVESSGDVMGTEGVDY